MAMTVIVKGAMTVAESPQVVKISEEKKQLCLREMKEKDKALRITMATSSRRLSRLLGGGGYGLDAEA
ncbi:hypothetical protein Pyn_35617 [Prunus yedoensis var. nudiflora]|uniref:Uncharacterized protein n=1 Tax=Prunus yedoensis var. nudiflora TaxID=2094558 RepID=A0A314UIZ5_PRUYE|nr:hypothetical protein Pyn_35617 [Prunus yedoensis var. nudiflora]